MRQVIAIALILVVLVAAALTPPRRERILNAARRASFELNVRHAFAVSPRERWQQHWAKFAEDTGATLVGTFHNFFVGEYVLFYITGGGTAFWFGRDGKSAYAMTNWHVVDTESEAQELETNALFQKMFYSIIDTATFPCPNFSRFDTYPSCAMNVEIDFGDFVLDVAVLKFPDLTAKVTTLPLGSYVKMKPRDKVYVVGAPVGIADIVEDGEIVDAQVPFMLDVPEHWRWAVPVDLNVVGGYSGSPVIDAKSGVVIGLLKGAFLDPRGSGRSVALMIPMELIATVLVTRGYPVSVVLK